MKPDIPQSWKEAITALPPERIEIESCPDPEQVWSAVRGELPPDRFNEVADHAAVCPLCALAWQLAETGSTAIGRPEVHQATRRWQAWYGLAAAAVVVMAAALVMQFRDTEPAPVTSPPQYRAPVEESVLSELPEGAILSREGCTLRWTGPTGATFDIQIATADFEILYRETGLIANEFTVTAELLAQVPGGGSILWQVEAVLPDGTRQPSRTFQVAIE